MRRLRGVLHPEAYHGGHRRTPFFEAWYVKVSTAEPARSWVFIPGIFRGRDRAEHHAFVQVVDASTRRVAYHRFPASAFDAADDRFDVRVADNTFSRHGLRVVLDGIDGRLEFDRIAPWPVTLRSPGMMGWFAWLPVMQCYHAVVSFDHGIHGHMQVGGEHVSFERGRGYIEKDWGRSFPRTWIWMQSNHFDRGDACLTVSIADVPWLGGSFPGFLIGLCVDGRLHRLATYTSARVTALHVSPAEIVLAVEDATRKLRIAARGGEVARIHVPSEQNMAGLVDERVEGTLDVRFLERREDDRPAVIFEDMGRHAAWEAHGDLRDLQRRLVGGEGR